MTADIQSEDGADIRKRGAAVPPALTLGGRPADRPVVPVQPAVPAGSVPAGTGPAVAARRADADDTEPTFAL